MLYDSPTFEVSVWGCGADVFCGCTIFGATVAVLDGLGVKVLVGLGEGVAVRVRVRVAVAVRVAVGVLVGVYVRVGTTRAYLVGSGVSVGDSVTAALDTITWKAGTRTLNINERMAMQSVMIKTSLTSPRRNV